MTRIDLMQHAGGPCAAMVKLEQRIELDKTIKHLIKIRASMINGCAHCIDMHWTDARAHGETETRLAQVATWHESPFFDERERAALALTDAVTHVAETHVPDDVWAEAERHFPQSELAHLLSQIAAINFWNRLAVSAQLLPDSYEAAAVA